MVVVVVVLVAVAAVVVVDGVGLSMYQIISHAKLGRVRGGHRRPNWPLLWLFKIHVASKPSLNDNSSCC